MISDGGEGLKKGEEIVRVKMGRRGKGIGGEARKEWQMANDHQGTDKWKEEGKGQLNKLNIPAVVVIQSSKEDVMPNWCCCDCSSVTGIPSSGLCWFSCWYWSGLIGRVGEIGMSVGFWICNVIWNDVVTLLLELWWL